MSESRSLMKRRPTELKEAFFFLPPLSLAKRPASSAFDDAASAASKSGYDQSVCSEKEEADTCR